MAYRHFTRPFPLPRRRGSARLTGKHGNYRNTGCPYWGHLFAGAVCYADDIVLLTLCPSALRILLNICSTFADTHGLSFKANKTQLICFHQHSFSATPGDIFFRDTLLQYTDEVTHLGHILTSNLNDRSDIIRVVKDLNRKANSLLFVFCAVDPFVKNFLLKSYCLSLYGCGLWSLSSFSIKILEVLEHLILLLCTVFLRLTQSQPSYLIGLILFYLFL